MSKQQGKIARNVASLFAGLQEPTTPVVDASMAQAALPPPTDQVVALPIHDVQLDPIQVRYILSVADLQQRAEQGSRWAQVQVEDLRVLGEHMRRHGQLQPIQVYPAQRGRPYQVLVGHRRVMAAELVGLPTVLVVVLPEEPDELEKLERQVGENVHRLNLNDMEKARIFERYRGAIARRGRPTRAEQEASDTVDESAIAARLGVKPERMAQIFRLTRFARPAQDIVIEEGWPETVLRPLHQALASLKLDDQAQVEALHELARRAALKEAVLTNAMVAEYVRELQRGQIQHSGQSWVQAQLRQLNDATRDLVRLREQFASGRDLLDQDRELLQAAIDNLKHEVAQTEVQVFGEQRDQTP
jgi:ParB/RepB/Spo0J family partition protein